MSDKMPCKECGVMVLLSTAKSTGGLCMPCKKGSRNSIELARLETEKERVLEKTCPFRALWRYLLNKVYNQESGFNELSSDEQQYFSVNLLVNEIYNGGFDQYFHNTSSNYCRFAEQGLILLGAKNSLVLLREAKKQLFDSNQVPRSQAERWNLIRKLKRVTDLNALDEQFCKDPDDLTSKLKSFALKNRLVNKL